MWIGEFKFRLHNLIKCILQPCDRLPCDIRCQGVLSCGHKCPSLCGEPCALQQCHICATRDEKGKVVDLILGLTLSDLDPSSSDLDNVTITLSCRHTFTVETLDGICGLKQSYQWDDNTGHWLKPTLPAESSIKTACCPTCRTPIDAYRYGRVTKRSNLDLLERNVATTMARNLSNIHQSFANIDRKGLENSLVSGAALDSSFSIAEGVLKRVEKASTRQLSDVNVTSALPVRFLGPQMAQICGLPKSDCQKWKLAIKPLQQIYSMALALSITRTAHVAAYQAAFSMLYEQALDSARQAPHPTIKPEVYALEVAKTKVGMAPPRADTRFQVEAIWTTIDVRLLLASLAEKVHEVLREKVPTNLEQLEAWTRFVAFVYRSCFRDASLASRIASTTNAYRQVLLSEMRGFKTRWRLMQFEVVIAQARQGGVNMEERKQLADQVQAQLDIAMREAAIKRRQCAFQGGLHASVIREQFDLPMGECFEHWQELVTALNRPSVFYQSISDDEVRAVVSSFKEYSKSIT